MLLLLLAALLVPPERPPLVLAQARKRAPERKKKPPPKPEAKPEPDDFDLLPKEAAPDPEEAARLEELDRKLAKRRTMLQFHQLSGFLTLATLAGTAVFGQLDYTDKYRGLGDSGRWHVWHRWMSIGASVSFAGTASLAVFAPVPIEKKQQFDTATLHKICMSVASAGMVAQIVLGIVTANSEGSRAQRNLALAHLIVGYTTVAATFTGFTVLTFN